jgi:GWxTD domain-containing protein
MTVVETWRQTPLFGAVGWTLFHSLWEIAIVAVVLAATLLVIRSSRARYAAACVALLATMITFAVTLGLFLTPPEVRGAIHFSRGETASIGSGIPTAAPRKHQLPGLAKILPLTVPLWIVGVFFCYLRHVISWIGGQRLRRRGVCSAPDFWQQQLNTLARRLQLLKPILLLESCFVDVPVVVGQLRPFVLVPLGLLAGLPTTQVEALLLHELAHIRRYDYVVNLFQKSIEALLFYHPAIWWISRVIREERENCCDDLVIATNGNAHEYAVALTTLEATRLDTRRTALAGNGGNLMKRIRRLLYPSEGPSMAFTPLLSAGVLLFAGIITVLQSQATQGASVIASAEQKTQAALLTGVQNPIVPRPLISPRPEITPAGNQGRTAEFDAWMDEVGYIISVAERTAFEGLQTDDERDQFIKQFWLRRDPSPGTPENEFKETHYRRIAEANQRFASSSGGPGWKTDRGRIYVQYGKPDELETTLANRGQQTYAVERWRYAAVDGTYADFEFADFSASGDFRLVQKQGSIPPVPRLPQPISLKMRAPLPKMLEIVSEAAGVTFVIASSDNRGLVTVDVRDALLPQILDAIFLPIGLQYTVEANRVIVTRPTAIAPAETAYRIAAMTSQTGATVTRIQIANNRRIPTDTIRSELQTKVGDPINLATISRDIRALYSLGFFDDVQFETESAGSGMIITFLVKERPLIRAIQYKGPPSVTIAEILQELRNAHTGLTPDSPYSLDRATAAAEVLKSMLVAKGYAQATVGIATDRVPPNAVNVVFVVDEGTLQPGMSDTAPQRSGIAPHESPSCLATARSVVSCRITVT